MIKRMVSKGRVGGSSFSSSASSTSTSSKSTPSATAAVAVAVATPPELTPEPTTAATSTTTTPTTQRADRASTDSLLSMAATPSLSSNSSFSGSTADMRREQTAIIFDWDDTLLPSTWLASKDMRLDTTTELDAEHKAELEAVEEAVISVLTKAMELGDVHVVTNAETGWIELSSEKFMPKVARMLPQLRLVSARSRFEPMHPNDPAQWKIEAFRETLRAVFDWVWDAAVVASRVEQQPLHVISFGDSYHERQALHVSTAELKNAHVKSVKFVERPDTDVLRRELDLVGSVLDYIASHPGDLDLMLSQSLLFGKEMSDVSEFFDSSF